MDVIQNKIAESGLITLDLEQYMPDPDSVATFDIQPFLFQGLILREKDFRAALADHDFSVYRDKYVGVYCSSDALIPMWAYMLVVTYLQGIARKVYAGDADNVTNLVAIAYIEQLDTTAFEGGRLVIKGCGKRNAREDLYLAISQKLLPVARSIMFGEPCSTVPIYKKKKTGSS